MTEQSAFDAERQFGRLMQFRHRLHDMVGRKALDEPGKAALQGVADATDKAAAHFGLGPDWWWPASSWGGKVPPRNWNVDLGPTHTRKTDER